MKDPFSLDGKNIIITGASSGIGRDVSIACSNAGATILMIARRPEQLQKTLLELNPGNHTFLPMDLTVYEQLEEHISCFVEKNGKIDGLVYAAGVEMTVPLQLIRKKHFEDVFSINVYAAFELSRIVTKNKFIDTQKGASIVFISSVRAINGQEGSIVYSASKGALASGMKAMAMELAPKRIRVNGISPSIIKTEMTDSFFESIPSTSRQKILDAHPLGFGSVNDISLGCIYLLSDASKWITGSNLVIDGGFSAR